MDKDFLQEVDISPFLRIMLGTGFGLLVLLGEKKLQIPLWVYGFSMGFSIVFLGSGLLWVPLEPKKFIFRLVVFTIATLYEGYLFEGYLLRKRQKMEVPHIP